MIVGHVLAAIKHHVIDKDNVLEQIEQHQPHGVDLSSGVESTRGVKDFAKILASVVLPTPLAPLTKRALRLLCFPCHSKRDF